jgi:uncharacterized protein (DUF983 family)
MDVRLKSRRSTREAAATHTIDDAPVVLPNWCPQCGGAGYLDSINLVRETKVQTCQACGLRWESDID